MAKSSLLPDYQDSVKNGEDNKRYHEKLMLIDGEDSYTILGGESMDDVDLWSAITYIHIRLYLLFIPSTRGTTFRITRVWTVMVDPSFTVFEHEVLSSFHGSSPKLWENNNHTLQWHGYSHAWQHCCGQLKHVFV